MNHFLREFKSVPQRKPKACNFDCDGVLVDSEIVANRIDAELLTEFGYEISTEDCIKKFTGMNAQTVQKLIFQESGIKLPENGSEVTQLRIFDAFEQELRPLISEVLKQPLWNTLRKCIASSSPRERVLKSLQITKQDHFFLNEQIFTSSQVARGKPFPDLFWFAAKQMEALPENCLVIEDSVAGIQAALSAKVNVVGFLGGSHAQFDWYQDKIKKFNVPIVSTSNELLSHIEHFSKS